MTCSSDPLDRVLPRVLVSYRLVFQDGCKLIVKAASFERALDMGRVLGAGSPVVLCEVV